MLLHTRSTDKNSFYSYKLATNNQKIKNLKKMPFIAQFKNQLLEINLVKDAHNFYTENYKML